MKKFKMKHFQMKNRKAFYAVIWAAASLLHVVIGATAAQAAPIQPVDRPTATTTATRSEGSPLEIPAVDVFFKKDETATVPIIMYHLVTKSDTLLGRYGITPDELESDLRYLKENGYATVCMADLIAFVHKGRSLPKKPVVLTFDDGNTSDYRYAYPLLKQYDMKAVLSVLGKVTDDYTETAEKNPDAKFPNLTWPQILEMKKSGVAEIQSHSYGLHGQTGSAKRKNESIDAYQERLRADLSRLQDRCAERLKGKPTTFTYPLGLMSESAQAVLTDLGFSASLSCCEGINTLTQGEPQCLFKMKRCIRPHGRSVARILENIS